MTRAQKLCNILEVIGLAIITIPLIPIIIILSPVALINWGMEKIAACAAEGRRAQQQEKNT